MDGKRAKIDIPVFLGKKYNDVYERVAKGVKQT